MPAVKLYRELLEACDGRVARADIGWVADAKTAARPDVERELVGVATRAEWERWKQAQESARNVDVKNRLFIEYVLE